MPVHPIHQCPMSPVQVEFRVVQQLGNLYTCFDKCSGAMLCSFVEFESMEQRQNQRRKVEPRQPQKQLPEHLMPSWRRKTSMRVQIPIETFRSDDN
eukprot:3716210-Amphidinium_carterae.1